MDRRRDAIGRTLPRRCRDYPSFSSSLLDTIYRSIDETDERGATKEQRTGAELDPVSVRKKQSTNGWGERVRLPTLIQPAGTRPRSRATATSSSSDGSSYGGFSSSEAESVCDPRLRPIRTSVANNSGPCSYLYDRQKPVVQQVEPSLPSIFSGGDEKRTKKDRYRSIRSRLRDLRKGRGPVSPGARLANFINSLFAVKSKVAASAGRREETSCSTASSYSRSCMSNTPSSRGRHEAGKRSVSFGPVSVIYGGDPPPVSTGLKGGAPRPPMRKVTEMLTRAEVEQDEEDEEDSDSSSDLFELENLAVIGRFCDELPVYKTTHVVNHGAISHGVFASRMPP
ncbi:hypothetical protein HPP92_023459 [Vanilla planifolia]|uniref:Uncharacterized protein n=1 Tax=Vanilla planifolia TaxID=51239 RepID=A0A835UE60_VANPL|nr:hypothetical protein HPP92_023459 [Vanilla planifolia]